MTSAYKNRTGLLFVSGSMYRRIPIFRYGKACEIFLRTLDAYRRKYGFFVHAYVVMPNHYHFLLWLTRGTQSRGFSARFQKPSGQEDPRMDPRGRTEPPSQAIRIAGISKANKGCSLLRVAVQQLRQTTGRSENPLAEGRLHSLQFRARRASGKVPGLSLFERASLRGWRRGPCQDRANQRNAELNTPRQEPGG